MEGSGGMNEAPVVNLITKTRKLMQNKTKNDRYLLLLKNQNKLFDAEASDVVNWSVLFVYLSTFSVDVNVDFYQANCYLFGVMMQWTSSILLRCCDFLLTWFIDMSTLAFLAFVALGRRLVWVPGPVKDLMVMTAVCGGVNWFHYIANYIRSPCRTDTRIPVHIFSDDGKNEILTHKREN